MTNTLLLEEYIAVSGLKKRYIAEKLGLSTYGLALKINNYSEFKQSEIVVLCELLHINNRDRERIFFALKGDE